MRHKVNYASFHDTLHLPGVGHLGATLPSQTKKMRLDMSYEDGSSVLEINVNGVHARVPIATVKIFTVVAESAAK